MTIDEVNELKNVLEDEVELYGLENDLDDKTVEELHFITNSFAKHVKNVYWVKGNDLYGVLKEFQESLNVLATGIFGRSFTTNALILFRDLPTVKKMYDESILQLKTEVEDYKSANSKLIEQQRDSQKELNNLKILVKNYENEINTLTKQINSLKNNTKSTSRPSYDSCSGGRRTYGGC